MRLIFINRFFYPDESATSLMLTDLVEGLAPLGLDIHVLTAAASYTPGSDGAQRRAPLDKVSVTHLPSLPLSHHVLAGRALNFLVFYCALIVVGLIKLRRGDIIICLTDPPLVGICAALLARAKRARLVHWVQDIYPETAIRLGFGSQSNPILRLAVRLRDWAWKHAHANVVIGDHMAAMLRSRGVSSGQIRIIQNWADDDALQPLEPADNDLRAQWGFGEDDIIVGYSGNLGRAHDASTMLDAAALLSEREIAAIRLLFIGGGAKHALLEAAESGDRLASVIQRRPYRPRAELRESLSLPDIHWLSLEPNLEGLLVPSKFYGAAAVGRPIIFIGDTRGEVARMIAEAGCGASFNKGDAQGVAEFVSALARDHETRQRLGQNARDYSVSVLSRTHRLQQWLILVEETAHST
jgi:glycosyltransferase involved in cell wall biosynthesis